MDKLMFLKNATPPWLLMVTEDIDVHDIPRIAVLDSIFIRNIDELYKNMSEKLCFPEYFGNNFNAIYDMLTDLNLINSGPQVILFTNSEYLLIDEDIEMLLGLFDIFRCVAEELSVPVEQGEAWDRPAMPFHVIFHVAPEKENAFAKRVGAAGISRCKLR